MKVINDNIIVKFEYDKSSTVVKQDNGLYVPERYVIEEADEEAPTAWGVTTNRKLINPQVIDIISGQYAGKRAFVYYGAFEIAKWIDDDQAIIPEKTILFFIDPIQCMPETYLGDEVFSEGPRTASGIWLTPTTETKEGVLIKITHVPSNAIVNVGDTVITVDANQYDLNYGGKKYIKLRESEMIGVKTETGYQPFNGKLLVEYLPDADLAERIAENDRRRAQRDFIDKHHWHISEEYAKGLDPAYQDLPEPKFVNCRVISGEYEGKKLLIFRNYGCILPNKQWIINMDTVVGIVEE